MDKSIVRVSVRGMASRDAVEAALQPLLRAAQVRQADTRLDGSTVAKSFVLRILPTAPRPADEVVRAILDGRRLPAGGWRELQVLSPTGTHIPLFVDPDRSLAQRRINWHLATAAKAINALHPSMEVTAAKSEGALTHRWEPLVRFTYDYGANSVQAAWESAIFARLGLDLDAVKKELHRRISEADALRRQRRG